LGKAAGAIIKIGKTAVVSSQEWQESAYEIHELSGLLFPFLGSLLADSLQRGKEALSIMAAAARDAKANLA